MACQFEEHEKNNPKEELVGPAVDISWKQYKTMM